MAASGLRSQLPCPPLRSPSPLLDSPPPSLSLLPLPRPLPCLLASRRPCRSPSRCPQFGSAMCGDRSSSLITQDMVSDIPAGKDPLGEAHSTNGSLAGQHDGEEHVDVVDPEEEEEEEGEEEEEEGEEEEAARPVWDDATITSAQEVYGEVCKILASRAIENRMFYLIEWKDGHEPSWLPATSIAKDVLAEYESPWWKATRSVEEQKLRELLADEGRDVDAVDENGRTALQFASGVGSEKCVRLLVEAGADVDGQDLDGLTPLHMATGYTRQNIVSALLELGADPEIEDSKGRTPLVLAQELMDKIPKANPLQFARRLALENILKLLESEVYENAEVEQVLDRRSTSNGDVEYLVKWKDGSEDEWIPAESVADDLVKDYEAGLEYGVAEEILDKRDENGLIEYLVRWADTEPTWESLENVAIELIAEYEKLSRGEVEKMLTKKTET